MGERGVGGGSGVVVVVVVRVVVGFGLALWGRLMERTDIVVVGSGIGLVVDGFMSLQVWEPGGMRR